MDKYPKETKEYYINRCVKYTEAALGEDANA